MARKYCVYYKNAGSGETCTFFRLNAEEAFIDLIEVLDNPSNFDIEAWIEN